MVLVDATAFASACGNAAAVTGWVCGVILAVTSLFAFSMGYVSGRDVGRREGGDE